ncbi:MAG: hypothetical protein ACPL4C_00520 [Brevinematia bacterium]
MNRFIYIIVLIFLVLFVEGFPQEVRYDIDSFFSTPRQYSLGNTYLINYREGVSFLENPAVVSISTSRFYLVKLTAMAGANTGYIYDALNLSSYNLNPFNPLQWIGFDWSSLTNELLKDPYGLLLNASPEVALFGPLALGYVGNGIGIMVYNDFFSSLNIRQAPGVPYVDLKAFAEIGLTFSFGTYFDIAKFSTLHIGASLSYSKRYKSPFFYGGSVFEVVKFYENTQKGIYEYDVGDSVWGNIGLIFEDSSMNLKYALVIENFFGRAFYWNRIIYSNENEIIKEVNSYVSYIPPKFSFGISYNLDRIPYIPVFLLSEFSIQFNLINMFYFDEFWFKKVHLGSEIALLKIFKLRGGISQGYPTFGIGIDFDYLTIDIAFYQYERGVLPGYQGSQNILGSIEIKF